MSANALSTAIVIQDRNGAKLRRGRNHRLREKCRVRTRTPVHCVPKLSIANRLAFDGLTRTECLWQLAGLLTATRRRRFRAGKVSESRRPERSGVNGVLRLGKSKAPRPTARRSTEARTPLRISYRSRRKGLPPSIFRAIPTRHLRRVRRSSYWRRLHEPRR